MNMHVGGGANGGNPQADFLLSAPVVGLDPMTHEIRTCAKTVSQMLNQLATQGHHGYVLRKTVLNLVNRAVLKEDNITRLAKL